MATAAETRRRDDVRRRWAIVIRVVVALMALSLGLLKGLVEAGLASPSPIITFLLVAAIALYSFAESVRGAAWRAKIPSKLNRRDNTTKAVIGALVEISDLRGVPLQDLGVSVFFVRKGRRLWYFAWTRRRPPFLNRYLRWRLSDSPQESDVDWTSGKGAIGTCWATDRQFYLNNLAMAVRWGDKDLPDDAAYSKVGAKAQQRMSRVDFVTTVGKYAEISAVPIREHGHLVGVLSVDVVMGDRTKQSATVLDSPDVVNILDSAAVLVQTARKTR